MNKEISDIEIQLINATRKFIGELENQSEFSDLGLLTWNSSDGSNTISIEREHYLEGPPELASLTYYTGEELAPNELGEMYVNGAPYNKEDKFSERYKEFLIKEIPELKGKLKTGILE